MDFRTNVKVKEMRATFDSDERAASSSYQCVENRMPSQECGHGVVWLGWVS